MIIDAHTHVDSGSKETFRAAYSELESSMDDNGIDAAIVMPMMGDDYKTRRFCEPIIEAAQTNPRVLPMAIFDPDEKDESLNAIMEYLANDLIIGVKFMIGYQTYHPKDLMVRPIIDLAAEKGVPVKFHTGATAKGQKAQLRYCCDPFQFDDIATLRPDLKVDCAHFNAPNFLNMSPMLEKNSNMCADLAGLFYGSADPRRNGWVKILQSDLYKAIVYLEDTSQIMFGSDNPICDQTEHMTFIKDFFRRHEFGQNDQRKILGENARRIYNVDAWLARRGLR
jgi:predicted TIM-barrel fold metal-dependent hydrolase